MKDKQTKTLASGKTKTYKYDIDWSQYKKGARIIVRLDDTITSLLEKAAEDKSAYATEAIKEALDGLHEIDCPTCEGSKFMYRGTAKNPKRFSPPRNVDKGDYSGKKIHSINCGPEIVEKLNKKSNKTEFITHALLMKFSKKGKLTCPTCKGSGKIIGGPNH